MKRVVWKYGLSGHCTLEMPKDARILTVREQGNNIGLWAEVDPDAPMELREFRLYGTGHVHSGNEPMKYLGTAVLMEGSLVMHAYEVLR